MMRVGVEARRPHVHVGQRLSREEERVRDEEELDRADVVLALTTRECERQGAGTRHESAQAAEQPTVDAAERLEELIHQPAQGQIAC